MLSSVFADGITDPLAGGSGWLGAGMLGLVIYWLLYKHIPALMSSHLEQVNQLSNAFKSSLSQVVAHCEEEMKGLAKAWTSEADRLVGSITKAKSEEADRIVDAVRESRSSHRQPKPKHTTEENP